VATTLFKDATYSVSGLVREIERGDIALPDIQRPFVWRATKVRDLLDSMYKGFPVGFLLFWETGADAGARQIGTSQAAPRLLIVDGQQRLTSLFAVMTGTEVLKADYSYTRIKIAFRPADATFAVTDAAIEKDPEFIPDVSVLWRPRNRRNVEREYLARLAAKRSEMAQDEQDRLAEAIDRLYDLYDYSFKVMVLQPDVEEAQVADIFVRINSEGVTLNQADFILTLMSVFWEKGRRELEDFARACKTPSLSVASPFNWYIQPQPPQLLRVTVALAFRRARLEHVYTLLRGRDMETGKVDPARRQAQFARLEEAQAHVVNLTHWHEFLTCLERAGFRGAKMISSENAIVYTYGMWLIGRVDHQVPLHRLREVIARWFFMAHTTGRYSGTFESQAEQDFGRLRDLHAGDGDGYCRALDAIVNDTLTNDYWTITLPNALGTSASKSPALLAYLAALNIHDADALLSTVKVRYRLDPAITAKKGIERHHLFPRQHLRKRGITDSKQINQIANLALVDWHDNIAISDQAPAAYWPHEIAAKPQLDTDSLTRQRYWHALPENWQTMAYANFLSSRRRLMAQVTRDAFARLNDSTYQPQYEPPAESGPAPTKRTYYGVSVTDLIDEGLLRVGDVLLDAQDGGGVAAQIMQDGRIEMDGDIHETVSAAAAAAKGGAVNGWEYWFADTPDGLRPLASLRDEFLTRKEERTSAM